MMSEIASNYEIFANVVRMRRSVRAFLPEPIPDDILDACFDLATLAPSSHNLEIWRFFDVRDPEKLAALYESRRVCYGLADIQVAIQSDDPAEAVEAVLRHPLLK